MKKSLNVLSILALLLFSCDFLGDGGGEGTKTFWATDFTTNRNYTLTADLLAAGRFCNIWVERGARISEGTAKEIARVFDNEIRPKMIDIFGSRNVRYTLPNGLVATFDDTLALADAFGDGNGKLTILFLNIRDGYQGAGDAYIGGYFWGGNFFPRSGEPGSNESDLIYMRASAPAIPGSKDSNAVIAHELQHMISFVNSYVERVYSVQGKDYVFLQDTWIDEGLSESAEWVYRGTHSTQRVDWFFSGKGQIKQGNNFYIWGNRTTPIDNSALLDDYATVNLFFQWLRLQHGVSIYKNIATSRDYDYKAVTKTTGSDWETLLRDWYAANYIGNSTGPHGYRSDEDLNKLAQNAISRNARFAPGGSNSISLFPGEAVYSRIIGSMPIPTTQGSIRYAGLDSTLVTSGTITGALLTYNINTEKRYIAANNTETGDPESGTITGTAPAASISPPSGGRSAASDGPYRIGAGDIIRIRGIENNNFSNRTLPADSIRPGNEEQEHEE